jgi:hypothetical protein
MPSTVYGAKPSALPNQFDPANETDIMFSSSNPNEKQEMRHAIACVSTREIALRFCEIWYNPCSMADAVGPEMAPQ